MTLNCGVTGYLSLEEIRHLDALADEMNCSRSALVRGAVIKFIEGATEQKGVVPAPYSERRRKNREGAPQ